jgi:dihydroflavonol-4-reductase
MGKTLLTGGTGFLGSHIARALLERGDELRLTLRPESRLDNLEGLEYESVNCDTLDRRAVGRAMRGVDRVFHVAGLTSLRASEEVLHRLNVEATQNVLGAALRAGVERVTYTSEAAAIGPAPVGESTADERTEFRAGPHRIPYVVSKRQAEVEALRIAAHGLPVVVVNPTFVFGAGDIYRSSTELVRRFVLRRIPAYVDGAINVVDVDDVARGHLLADERGEPGERYILGNRNYTLDRLFADLGRMTGIEPPAVKLPVPAALALAAAAERLPGRAEITTVEVRAASLWWTYRNTKAKRELEWKPSPHEDTVEATVAWYLDREGERLARSGRRQPLALRVAGGTSRRVGSILGRVLP